MPIKVCKSHSVMARFCAWCEFASFVVMLLSVHRPQPQHQRRRHRQCVPPASARRLQLASAHIVRQRSHKLNSKPALVSYAIYIQRPKKWMMMGRSDMFKTALSAPCWFHFLAPLGIVSSFPIIGSHQLIHDMLVQLPEHRSVSLTGIIKIIQKYGESVTICRRPLRRCACRPSQN